VRVVVDFGALGLLIGWVVVVAVLRGWVFRPSPLPSLAFSRLRDLQFPSWRSRCLSYPFWFHVAALLFLMMAFVEPRWLLPSPPLPSSRMLASDKTTQGVAIYLVLDHSGSMAQAVETEGKAGRRETIPKIDLLKEVTTQFIADRPADLLGLLSFARVPRVLVPLTLDREALLAQLEQIQPVSNPDQDGTAMGYAIFKTTSLMAATRHFADNLPKDEVSPYAIKAAAMIVVTDGFQNPSRLDQGNRLRSIELDDAAAYAKSQDVRLYIVNIDPIIATESYAPQRRQLEAVASSTGGRFYLVNGAAQLKSVYADIDRLEKGTIHREGGFQTLSREPAYSPFPLYSFCLIVGLGFLGIALFIDSIVLKVVP